jgi:hypothetical protein
MATAKKETKKEADTTSEPSTDQRRLVIVTGDKGGVGKSFFARGLVQTYLDIGVNFKAIDADISNPQLYRFFNSKCSVEKLDLFTRGNLDIFLDDIKTLVNPEKTQEGKETEKSQSLFLLELPPQSRRILEEFIKDMNLFYILDSLFKMRVTMVVVISRVLDSVDQLLHLHKFCGNQVDYVVVKNLFFGEPKQFSRYDSSLDINNLKAPESKISLKEITMPDLIEPAFDYIDQHSLTFEDAIKQVDRPSVQGRVRSWLNTYKSQISLVKEELGLGNVNL